MSVKRTRNRMFTVGALLTASGAIGAGALVSSGAMAATDEAADDTVTVSMVQIDENGEGYECIYDDDPFIGQVVPVEAVPMDELPAGGEAFEVEIGEDGTITVDGEVIDPTDIQVGEIVTDMAVALGSVTAGEPIPVEDLPELADDATWELATAIELRPGTEEECAALLDQFDDPASMPTSGAIGVTGTTESGS